MILINKIKIRLFCKKVGSDEFNNTYYEEKHKSPNNKKKRRYVIYNGINEPSKVPSEWHCWLHYTSNKAPVNIKTDKHPWQKIHLPNLTGTKYDHFLSDRIYGEEVKKYYQSWNPNS